jgi:hypothetical protein
MSLTREEVEVIAQIIEEEVEDKVLSALQDFATSIKEYIEESINENNNVINSHINNLLSEVNIGNSNSNVYDEEENYNEDVVVEQKQNLKESIRGMFEQKQTEFRDSSGGESLKFKSSDLIRNQVSKAELSSFMPPDEGAYYEADTPGVHTKSVLDIAASVPDPSVADALTKDYSGLMKKLNSKK